MASKLKGKEWYPIVAPKFFGDLVLGETISMDPEKIKGRVIEIGLMDFMDRTNKYYFKFSFKIVDVKNKKAETKYVGHTCTRDYLARIVRLRTTRIDTNDIIQLADNKFRVKTISVSNRRISNPIATDIRRAATEHIKNELTSMKTEDFVKAMIEGKMQARIRKKISKVYPLRHFEIRKTELL